MTLADTFGPLTVRHDNRVLRPRPWTLLQSEWAATLAERAPAGPLVELCAGAGHIGLAAAVIADRDLVQVELDPVAARFARRNAEDAGRAGRVDVRVAPLQTAFAADERFPIMIADPPYLPSHQVRLWPDDPPAAIDGGADGLAIARLCLGVAVEHLIDDGDLLLQTAGPAQSDAVADLVETMPLRQCEVRIVDNARAISHLRRL
jgi:release factor glutamine methyltransferase